MRKITVKIPRLPVVAPQAAAQDPTFGPLGWEWASQGDDGDEAAVFVPLLELLHVRRYNFAAATCAGAVAWRLDPEPPNYRLYQMTGAAIVQALESVGTANLYAISAAGAELGPIVIETVA